MSITRSGNREEEFFAVYNQLVDAIIAAETDVNSEQQLEMLKSNKPLLALWNQALKVFINDSSQCTSSLQKTANGLSIIIDFSKNSEGNTKSTLNCLKRINTCVNARLQESVHTLHLDDSTSCLGVEYETPNGKGKILIDVFPRTQLTGVQIQYTPHAPH